MTRLQCQTPLLLRFLLVIVIFVHVLLMTGGKSQSLVFRLSQEFGIWKCIAAMKIRHCSILFPLVITFS